MKEDQPTGHVITSPEVPVVGGNTYGDHPGGLRFRREGDGDWKWVLARPQDTETGTVATPFEICWEEVSWAHNRELRNFKLVEAGVLLASGRWRDPMTNGGKRLYYLSFYPGKTHWNGVSGGGRDTRLTLWGSCPHDMLYRANREGLLLISPERPDEIAELHGRRVYDISSCALREAADQQMRRHLVSDARRGKPEKGGFFALFRAKVILELLRVFGSHAWNGQSPKTLNPGERLISSRMGIL